MVYRIYFIQFSYNEEGMYFWVTSFKSEKSITYTTRLFYNILFHDFILKNSWEANKVRGSIFWQMTAATLRSQRNWNIWNRFRSPECIKVKTNEVVCYVKRRSRPHGTLPANSKQNDPYLNTNSGFSINLRKYAAGQINKSSGKQI